MLRLIVLALSSSAVLPETLVWSDEFDSLDESKWEHLVTTYPLEDFQYYRNHRSNSWVSEGALHVMPTLTSLEYGEDFLYNGCIDLNQENPERPCNIWWNKEHLCKDCAGEDIVKPIQLARLHSNFSFRFGRVEWRAKLPLTDWIRPALWLMPVTDIYGGFPASGEIDMMESSGNWFYYCGQQSRGVDTVQSNLHMGLPGPDHHWSNASLKTNSSTDYAKEFHIYELNWTQLYITFSVDGEEIYRLLAPGPPGGLFDYASLPGENIWAHGGPMAPFDTDFYFIISAQSGGWPFYDHCSPPAPWGKNSGVKRAEFYEARDSWFQSWRQPFSIDYIRVYQ